MTRVAAYVRLSKETPETTSPRRQRSACRKVVDDRGWALVETFEDLDLSAYTGAPRPAFDEMMGRLDEFDVVVVWKLDRLYRKFTGFASTLERLETAGVQLVSATEAIDTTTPMGKGVAGILAAQAEQESANTSLRTRSAIEHLEQQGVWRGGRRPYGWEPAETADGRKLAPVPSEVEAILEAAGRVIAGESVRQIVLDWNDRGVPTATGKPWAGASLRQILRSPRLIGQLADKNGRTKLGEDGEPLPGPPAIMPDPTWRRLQRAMESASVDFGRRHDAALLSGLVECSLCGRKCHGWAADHPQASYICYGRGEGTCKGVSMLRRWVDSYVVGAVLERLDPDTITAARAATSPAEDPDVDRRREDLDRQLDRLTEDRLAGMYDDDPVRFRRLYKQVSEQRQQLDRTVRRSALADVLPPVLDEDVWENKFEPHQRRTILRAALVRVELGPVTVRGKFDEDRLNVVFVDQLQPLEA